MIQEQFYTDDYLDRSEKTVKKSLNEDANKLSLENLQELGRVEAANKNRPAILIKIKELTEAIMSRSKPKSEDVKPLEEKPSVPTGPSIEPVKKEEMPQADRWIALWRSDNYVNGVTMTQFKPKKVFEKGWPVEITLEEKRILEKLYLKSFDFKPKTEGVK